MPHCPPLLTGTSLDFLKHRSLAPRNSVHSAPTPNLINEPRFEIKPSSVILHRVVSSQSVRSKEHVQSSRYILFPRKVQIAHYLRVVTCRESLKEIAPALTIFSCSPRSWNLKRWQGSGRKLTLACSRRNVFSERARRRKRPQ